MSSDEFSATDAVSDIDLGADVMFGMLVGTPLTYLTVVVICLAAGLGVVDALSVAVLPCLLSGVFFGGVIPLSRQMARHERAETAARLRATAAVPAVAVLAAAPAA